MCWARQSQPAAGRVPLTLIPLNLMADLISPHDLTLDQIEEIEKMSMRVVFNALREFWPEAVETFAASPDRQNDIAEDITRDALDRFPGFPARRRLYGTIDYKRSGHAVLPEFSTKQALMIDSKAEMDDNTATLQTSQTSLPLSHIRDGVSVTATGELPEIMVRADEPYLTTTVFVHYHYSENEHEGRRLHSIKIAALPNGKLASRYVPSASDTIWSAGRNAPSRGEPLRIRLKFDRLLAKKSWRVQHISHDGTGTGIRASWCE